jgi:hypothetical protein
VTFEVHVCIGHNCKFQPAFSRGNQNVRVFVLADQALKLVLDFKDVGSNVFDKLATVHAQVPFITWKIEVLYVLQVQRLLFQLQTHISIGF